ncbi:hypothetical protein ACFE04_007566 [Oxalis oulophora]
MAARLIGSEIHGFHTLQDLDVPNIMEEARTRWLRPNEIQAILCNHSLFEIKARPMNLPPSGTIVLFDRKMLRNFRKDGHTWKKKNDGKTVKEAHEHLKVGNEERIHVYYAHGLDNPTFVRRCYWLLDKAQEHIVLVHYRETQEGSPVTPVIQSQGSPNISMIQMQGSPSPNATVISNSSTGSDNSTPWLVSEEIDSGEKEFSGVGDNVRNHEMTLHEINTLEWDELLATNDPNNPNAPKRGVSGIGQENQIVANTFMIEGNSPSKSVPFRDLTDPSSGRNDTQLNFPERSSNQRMENQVKPSRSSGVADTGYSLNDSANGALQSQKSFGQWMNYVMNNSLGAVDDPLIESPIEQKHDSFIYPEQIFNITDISPTWAYSTEKTKILITGFFHEKYRHLERTNLNCTCGDVSVSAEFVQVGVYRCLLSPHSAGVVNFYLSLDGHKPISQILNFEYRTPVFHEQIASSEDKTNWEEFRLQMRLAHLLFSKSKTLDIFASKVTEDTLNEAKRFSQKTLNISNSWAFLMKSIENNITSFEMAKGVLFEITLKNKLKEWLLERIIAGCKTTEYDSEGQGAIHLCAILGYTWAVHLFSWSGLSLDFRDKRGWTALHWAAYYGREKMVAVLLAAGAKPNLVSDPTSKYPGGCTAADLAYMNGYDGVAAYLSEKALVAQFNDMSIAGNASGTLQTDTNDTVNQGSLTEDDIYVRDTLSAYRTAADAAGRIQAAFRERSFKLRTKAVQVASPEEEARTIIAAMKIQHAFRKYETKKQMAAAVRIQFTFRTWKTRKDFLNKRRQAIRIQAAFRGFQVRRHYRKILWSVGVLEKVILRWRLKRKGFRGLQVAPAEVSTGNKSESDTEEDFFKTSRKQAEERVERAVVTVQSMFRSKKTQQEYRHMKLAHSEAESLMTLLLTWKAKSGASEKFWGCGDGWHCLLCPPLALSTVFKNLEGSVSGAMFIWLQRVAVILTPVFAK